MPRVERGEFINVGVILYCAKKKFLDCRIHIDEKRLTALFPLIDIHFLEQHLDSYSKICRGEPSGGPIALFDMPSRFRWLTARRSTIIQSAPVHPGFCTEPSESLEKLFQSCVL